MHKRCMHWNVVAPHPGTLSWFSLWRRFVSFSFYRNTPLVSDRLWVLLGHVFNCQGEVGILQSACPHAGAKVPTGTAARRRTQVSPKLSHVHTMNRKCALYFAVGFLMHTASKSVIHTLINWLFFRFHKYMKLRMYCTS